VEKKQCALEVTKGEVESTSELGFAFVFQETSEWIWERRKLSPLHFAQIMRVLASVSGV